MPASWDALLACGSSPRGRGKPHRSRRFELHAGLIPARAGKTRRRPAPRSHRWAHPRAGGENEGRFDALCETGGLIPARAGKTGRPQERVIWKRAHPRAGGENRSVITVVTCCRGSSPRGRGKPPCRGRCMPSPGLIPARAGKTSPACLSTPPRRAHPRAGGENPGRKCAWRPSLGSSPRGRGKHTVPMLTDRSVGLIPARAGKTVRGDGSESE